MAPVTSQRLSARPSAGDYAPYYAGYVALVPSGDLLELLSAQGRELASLVRGLPVDRRTHRYAPGKWTIAESLLHVADTERIFAYRALRIARGDETPLPGFEQDAYVRTSGADARTLTSLADELAAVRDATLTLLGQLDETALARRGTASGFPVTVLGVACILHGHAAHHLRILREQYLAGAPGTPTAGAPD